MRRWHPGNVGERSMPSERRHRYGFRPVTEEDFPVLAAWLTGTAGQQLAQASVPLEVAYNNALTSVYHRFGARIADVATAFDSTNFSTQVTLPGVGTVPANVARICTWTWECAAPPVGPNEHANQAGYAIIARTFRAAYLTGHR